MPRTRLYENPDWLVARGEKYAPQRDDAMKSSPNNEWIDSLVECQRPDDLFEATICSLQFPKTTRGSVDSFTGRLFERLIVDDSTESLHASCAQQPKGLLTLTLSAPMPLFWEASSLWRGYSYIEAVTAALDIAKDNPQAAGSILDFRVIQNDPKSVRSFD